MQPLFSLFSLAMFTATALAGYHAFTHGARSFYLVSLAYGFLLEHLTIQQFAAYTYPVHAYPLHLFDVPFAIAFGWGAIIYTGYSVATAYRLRLAYVPLFAALFALHVDLSMDAIAIHFGFWSWTQGGVWFGVPLGNFFGWFCVAFFYTGSFVVAQRYLRHDLPAALVAIVVSLGLLIGSLQVWIDVVTTPTRGAIVLAAIVGVALALVLRADRDPTPVPGVLQGSTFVFHGFFLALYLATGMLLSPYYVLLAPVAVGLFVVGYVVLHQPSLEPLEALWHRGKAES